MISRTGTHATLALAFLARLKPGEYSGAAQIAADVGAPRNYLGKLLKSLAEQGLVESQKGHGGGFRLAKAGSKITLYDILEPVDRVSKWNGCFMGQTRCNEKSPCNLHQRWSKVRNDYLKFLKTTTITDVADGGVSLLEE